MVYIREFTFVNRIKDADRPMDKANYDLKPKLDKLVHIIDDDFQGSEVLQLWLEMNGYTVHCDSNGLAALEFLQLRVVPQIILLNLQMPIMDGFEFREIQANNSKIGKIPVVIVSAFDPWDVRHKLSHAKPEAYVQKPFGIDHILKTVQHHIH